MPYWEFENENYKNIILNNIINAQQTLINMNVITAGTEIFQGKNTCL